MLWWTLRQLEAGDESKRADAAEKLGATRDKRALQALISALKDTSSRVREVAAKALGQLGDAAAVDPLLDLLKDESATVRMAAVRALGGIRGARAVEPLMAALVDDDAGVRGAAAEMLERGWESESKPALEEYRRREDERKRLAAEAKAKRLAEEAEAQRLAQEVEVKRLVEAAVNKNTGYADFTKEHFKDEIRRLKPLGRPVRDALMEALTDANSTSYSRSRAAGLLDALFEPKDDRERAYRWIGRHEYRLVDRPTWAAFKARGAVAFEALVFALNSDEGRYIPKLLVELVGEGAIEPLIAVLKRKEADACPWAAEELGQFKDARVVEALIETLEKGPARRDAASSLGKIGSPEAIEPLEAALGDADEYVRVEAAKALGEIADGRAAEALLGALGSADDALDEAAAEGLGNIGDRRVVDSLAAVLPNLDPKAQIAAADALGKLGDGRGVEVLVKLSADWKYGERAVGALARALEFASPHITTEGLRAVAGLTSVQQMQYSSRCGETGPAEVDCSLVRQLARQELIRRGLEA